MIKIQSNLFKLPNLVILSFLLLTSQVWGGYKYVLQDTGSASESSEILVEGQMMKMAIQGEGDSEMIYDGESESLLIIDHSRKSYMSLGRQEIEEISGKINAAMAMMEQQLASVPPAQRDMMEKMMKQHMPKVSEKMKVTIERSGEKATIVGYETEKVEMKVGDGKRSELWVADWSDVEGGKDVAATMKGMSELFKGFMDAVSKGPMAGMISGDMFDQFGELNGFPIRTDEYDVSGKLVKQLTLTNIESLSVDALEFKAPKGYKKQKIGM